MKYSKAEMEINEFDVEDIIRTSGDIDNPSVDIDWGNEED